MTFIKRIYQRCPNCGNTGLSARWERENKEDSFMFECPFCGCVKDNDEEAKTLFEDAYRLYLKSVCVEDMK